MTQVTLLLEPELSYFYTKVAEQIGIPLEQVLTDALFKLAGELSLSALKNRKKPVIQKNVVIPPEICYNFCNELQEVFL